MLQQTQVKTVIPYFNRFIKRFPDLHSLSQASEATVLKHWSGLGYYSRARNLHRTSKILVKLHKKNSIPTTPEGWMTLPGIGRYTAGAIVSIAQNQIAPIVDGNIIRVFSRVYGIKNAFSPPTLKRFWKLSEHWVEIAHSLKIPPRDFNQALMELGALVCTPQTPQCMSCPLQPICKATRSKQPEQYPGAKKTKKTVKFKEEKIALFWTSSHQKTKLLLVFDSHSKWKKGLWDLPDATLFKLTAETFTQNWTLKYTITHHQILRTVRIHKLPKRLSPIQKKIKYQWILLREISNKLPIGAALSKFISQQLTLSKGYCHIECVSQD